REARDSLTEAHQEIGRDGLQDRADAGAREVLGPRGASGGGRPRGQHHVDPLDQLPEGRVVGMAQRKDDRVIGSELTGLVVAYAEELRNLGLDEPALRELTDIFVRARAVAHDGPDVAMASRTWRPWRGRGEGGHPGGSSGAMKQG